MKLLFYILFLLPLIVFAQKEDYNWTVGNMLIDFNYNPPKTSTKPNFLNMYNHSCISDKDGKFLFRYGLVSLYDSDDNVIFKNTGAVAHSPSLIPYPYDRDKTLFFYSDVNTGLCCAVIDNENPTDIQIIKTFPKGRTHYTFIQQKCTENIWYLTSVDSKIEISLITKDGFSTPKTLDVPYNVSFSIVSQDNNNVLFSVDGEQRSVLYDFDGENGYFTKMYELSLSMKCAFSKSGKYIYSIEKNDEKSCDVVRYDIQKATDETTLFSTKYIIGQIPTQEPPPLKLAPDGNIYVVVGNYLYAIYDCDTENAYVKPNVIVFDKYIDYLPYTFHYSFESDHPTVSTQTVCASQIKSYRVAAPEPNVIYHWTITGGTADKTIGNEITVKWADIEDDGVVTVYGEDPETHCVSESVTYNIKIHKLPSAAFDNAIACHGQPLNILSSGDAPFEISYTIDGEAHGIKTSEPTYQLPDIPGKYVITKIKDASCEAVPTVNNAAEIAPEMRQVRIVEE